MATLADRIAEQSRIKQLRARHRAVLIGYHAAVDRGRENQANRILARLDRAIRRLDDKRKRRVRLGI